MGAFDSKLFLFRRSLKKYNMPIVIILGATGTGKSKLAIELAKLFNGEIISADSMQVYKGLDVITNKVTEDELSEVKHHCISCIDPLSRYTVVDYRNQALPIINNLLDTKKLPIIVGGTNYYIESLLWDVLIKPEDKNHLDNQLIYDKEIEDANIAKSLLSSSEYDFKNLKENLFKIQINQISCEDIPSDILHRLLQEVDPAIASTLHPNDKRKIIRSLQVYQQHQLRLSDILQNQRSQKGGCSIGGPLRYKSSLMFWIQCDKSVLDKRLDERVDKMLDNGLVNELLEFHTSYNQNRLMKDPDAKYTEGIFQSIGFKEFHEYLILPDEEKKSTQGVKFYNTGINDMKLRTRQYATKQKKWIVNRFLRNHEREQISVYGLNGTDLNCWNENVLNVAVDVTKCFIEGITPQISPLQIENRNPEVRESHYCDICDKIIIGREVWKIHLSSRRHERMKQKKKKLKEKSYCLN